METKREIEQLKSNIFSDNWELVCSSADRLGSIGGRDIITFLISLLENDNPGIRNRAALALSDIGNNRAVKPLFKAIFKKENFNYNGTLVFGLESLDCSKHLRDLFSIIFYHTYEAKMGAMAIIREQSFDFNTEDLLEIKRMWNDCLTNPKICPDFDNEKVKLEMQDSVDGFIEYLED